jgi:hypothetical protein
MHGGRHKFWLDTAIIALIAAAARLIVLQLLPPGVESTDLHSWQIVAGELHAGRNPYATTTFLNWPPLWLHFLAVIDKAAAVLQVPFKTLLRLVLITSDVAVVIVAHRLVHAYATRARPDRTALTTGSASVPEKDPAAEDPAS